MRPKEFPEAPRKVERAGRSLVMAELLKLLKPVPHVLQLQKGEWAEGRHLV